MHCLYHGLRQKCHCCRNLLSYCPATPDFPCWSAYSLNHIMGGQAVLLCKTVKFRPSMCTSSPLFCTTRASNVSYRCGLAISHFLQCWQDIFKRDGYAVLSHMHLCLLLLDAANSISKTRNCVLFSYEKRIGFGINVVFSWSCELAVCLLKEGCVFSHGLPYDGLLAPAL